MYDHVDADTLTSSEKMTLIRKWKLVGPPDVPAQWVIDLENPTNLPARTDVSATLQQLAKYLQIYHDTGPHFGEIDIEKWAGESSSD